MSTEPRPQAAFIQVNQNAAEQDAPNSALVYLFQEVSKLASATHNGFLDARPPSIWLDETPRRGGLIAKKEDDARSFQPCQHSLSRMSAYSQVNSGKEESHSQENRECRSPWKVLSLINLQCERLMHRRCAEDSACSSTSSTTDLLKDQLSVKPLTAAADVAEQDCVRPVEGRDCTRGVNETQPHGHSVQPQTPEKTSAVKPELVEEKAAASPQWQRRREVKLSTKGQMVLNQGSKAETCFPNQDILTEPFPENVSQPTHILDAAQITKLAFHSNEDVALSKQLTLDCNANIVLTTVPLYDTQLPSPSSMLPSSLSFSTSEHHSLPKQDFKITGPKPERAHAPREEDFPSVSAQLQSHSASSTTSKPDPSEVPGTELSPPLSQQWRTKTQRKQPHPSRSVDLEDPGLQGVTFRMDAEVDDSREQCRLLITSKYRKELCKSVRKPRLRTRTSQKSLKSSSSEEESDPATHVSKDKVCASCCTRKTPMWRDAEDGTPLCNACGIRYKKYRVRCVNCWHIPRKEGNSNSCCLKCGNFVKLASAQRKHTP